MHLRKQGYGDEGGNIMRTVLGYWQSEKYSTHCVVLLNMALASQRLTDNGICWHLEYYLKLGSGDSVKKVKLTEKYLSTLGGLYEVKS